MATVINNPSTSDSEGSGTGLLVGIVLAIIIAFLFFAYGLPAIRDNTTSGTGETNINVPDDINVDVNGGTTPQ